MLDSIDQGAKVPLDSVTVSGDTLKLELKLAQARFEGKIAPDGKSIAGTWTERGKSQPLTFNRGDAPPPPRRRPQDPVKPYPYEEHEVVVESKAAGVRLGGTLTLPKPPAGQVRAAKSLPAVLLITGSGQQDRDEMVMGHRPFLVLADHLTRSGIAVLRLDDRGIGKSTGDFWAALPSDFVADARAAVAFLRAHPDIDPGRVGLLGHSEGGITAPVLAAEDTKIAFVVMLGGPGVPMDRLLLRQGREMGLAIGMSDGTITQLAGLQRKAFDLVKRVGDGAELERRLRAMLDEVTESATPEQRAALGLTGEHANHVQAQLALMLLPWFRELVRYDPAPVLKKVKCPVLAVCGALDLQVAADENLPAIKAALEAGGNRDVRTVELPAHNHLLQQCKTGSITEYASIEQTMSPAALNVIADWVSAHTAPSEPAEQHK
jgi:pimeloyl-ACP methyl ester carboxylesterase